MLMTISLYDAMAQDQRNSHVTRYDNEFYDNEINSTRIIRNIWCKFNMNNSRYRYMRFFPFNPLAVEFPKRNSGYFYRA